MIGHEATIEDRYSRQRLFRPIGDAGQDRLAQSTVAVIGCGALGSAIAETLVRAGVGRLILVDRDVVELSNLQRQQLFTERHARDSLPKVAAAEERLRDIRADVRLTLRMDHADGMLMEQIAKESDLLMDATDNFETRLAINDAANKHGVPWIYGACVGSSGAVFPFVPGSSACFRCLLPVLPAMNATCDTVGVIGPAVQTVAALQCAEALKLLTGNSEALMRKVHHFDLWAGSRIDLGVSRVKDASCPTCGPAPAYPSLEPGQSTNAAVLCGRNTVQIIPDKQRPISLAQASESPLLSRYIVRRSPFFIEMVAEGYRLLLFANGRVLVHGMHNTGQALKLYHQLFG